MALLRTSVNVMGGDSEGPPIVYVVNFFQICFKGKKSSYDLYKFTDTYSVVKAPWSLHPYYLCAVPLLQIGKV